MDGTTEPIIVVIGHPIAGNPTQFALETGFQASQIDCRVLSIDLPPARLAAALAGMDAMRFRAVWVTPSCRLAAQPVREENALATPLASDEALQSATTVTFPFPIDMLVHDPAAATSDSWRHHCMKQKAWLDLAARTLQTRDTFCRHLTWVDCHADVSEDGMTRQRQSLLEWFQFENNRRCENLTLEQIEIVRDVKRMTHPLPDDDVEGEPSGGIRVIVFADCKNPPSSQWTLPPDSLTIDINENWDADYLLVWERLRRSAADHPDRDCIRGVDVHAACLSRLTQTLFGQNVSPDIFLDAVDEYLAV